MRLFKLMGAYLYCGARENSWLEAVKVFERPSLTHKSQLISSE